MWVQWGCKTLPLREAEPREGWMTEWQQCARNKCSRTGAAGAQSFSRAACLYGGSRRHATRLLSGTSRRKSLNLPSDYWKGDNRTVWGDFYSFWKWKGKLRCFIYIFYSRKYILWLIRHVLRNAYCIHDDALWNGHVELL